jgi:hypothetical protein
MDVAPPAGVSLKFFEVSEHARFPKSSHKRSWRSVERARENPPGTSSDRLPILEWVFRSARRELE